MYISLKTDFLQYAIYQRFYTMVFHNKEETISISKRFGIVPAYSLDR